MKKAFVFLIAVAIILPLVIAIDCDDFDGKDKKICRYIQKSDWSEAEKDSAIQELINSGGVSLDGDFESTMGNPYNDIELNKVEEVGLGISDENKEFLIDFSSIGVFGYVVYSFLKKYYLLRFAI